MKHSLIIALGVLAAIASVDPASADVRSITYKGVVTLGTDDSGLFGTAGANLVGNAITSVFQYDTTLGARTTTATADTLTGGLDFSTASPVVSATFTINDRSYTFAPDYYGSAAATSGSSVSEFVTSTNQEEAKVSLSGLGAPASLLTSFFFTGNTTGNYFFSAIDSSNKYDGITFTTTSASVGAVSSAPEPGSWALVLGGVGAMGLLLRRRRPPAVAA